MTNSSQKEQASTRGAYLSRSMGFICGAGIGLLVLWGIAAITGSSLTIIELFSYPKIILLSCISMVLGGLILQELGFYVYRKIFESVPTTTIDPTVPLPTPDPNITLVIDGIKETGKSALLSRYTQNNYPDKYESTIGIDSFFGEKIIQGKLVPLRIWDRSGDRRLHQHFSQIYLKKVSGILLVYDITNQKSFEKIEEWRKQITTQLNGLSPKPPFMPQFMLIGNKSDKREWKGAQQDAVTTEEGARYAKAHGMLFFETSAKDDTNVSVAFESLVSAILNPRLTPEKPAAPKEGFKTATSVDSQSPVRFHGQRGHARELGSSAAPSSSLSSPSTEPVIQDRPPR